MSLPSALPTLVLIHGLQSSPKEFSLLQRILTSRQVSFHCLEIPGYTLGMGESQLRWQDWVQSAAAALNARYGRSDSLILGGLCVGGAIATALARNDARVCGLVMLSPTFAYDGWAISRWMKLRTVAYRTGLDRWISVREREPYGIKNPKMRCRVLEEFASRGHSSIGPMRLPLRAIRETERLYAASVSWLSSLRIPLLVMHAREDEIATVASVRRVMGRSVPLARIEVLEESYHMITIDDDRQRVAHALADFVGAPAQEAVAPPSDRMIEARRARELGKATSTAGSSTGTACNPEEESNDYL